MAANVTVIPGAEEINYHFRNYAYSSILSDMPILSLGLATDLDRLVYKNAAGDPFTLATSDDVGGGTFLELSDTPSSYSGQGLKGVRVNAGATALEFFTLTYLSSVSVDGTTITGDGASTPLALDSTLKTNYDSAYSHISLTDNPHSVTASQVGAEPTLPSGTDTYILKATGSTTKSWINPAVQSWASKWTSITGGIQYSSGSVSILNTAINTTESFTGLTLQAFKTAGATDYADTFTGANIYTLMSQSGGEIGNYKGLNVEVQMVAGSVGSVGNARNWYSIYGRANIDGGNLTLNCYGMYFSIDTESGSTIANDSYVVYANSDLLGSVLGKAYGLYINDTHDNLDFGIYVDSPAPNKFDGLLFFKENASPSYTITGYHGIYATSSGLYSMDDTSVYLLSAWNNATGYISHNYTNTGVYSDSGSDYTGAMVYNSIPVGSRVNNQYAGISLAAISAQANIYCIAEDYTSEATTLVFRMRKDGGERFEHTRLTSDGYLTVREPANFDRTVSIGVASIVANRGALSTSSANLSFKITSDSGTFGTGGGFEFISGDSQKVYIAKTGEMQFNVTSDSITEATNASKIFAKDIASKARMHIIDEDDTVAKPICASGTTSGVTIATGLTTTPAINIDYQITGKVVTLNVPEVTGAGNSSAMTITTLPTHLRPAATRYALIEIMFGNYRFLGSAKINTTGVIELESSYDCSGGQSFTAFYTNLSGSGIVSQSIKYSL